MQPKTRKPGHYRVEEQRDYACLERFHGIRSHAVAGVHEIIAEALRDHLPSGARVLDLACGAGALVLRLQKIGYQVTACDLIADKLQVRDGVAFVQADLNDDFAEKFPGEFDGIVASEIIEHLENPRHFLREVNKLLKPDAPLIISTPNIDSPFSKAIFVRTGRHRWFSDADYEESGHIMPTSEVSLRRALSETGFEVEQTRSGGAVPGSGWWKMRLLAWLLSMIATGQSGEILVVIARRAAAI
jgi:2-polyprenyl-3-methyl-5-hydroxy-6-metoxy-1,4-benzoquinol methylase